MCDDKITMNTEDEKVITNLYLWAYILVNGMCAGNLISNIHSACDGQNATNGIIVSGALTALTAMRAIHYYKKQQNLNQK